MVAPQLPLVVKTADNPDGVDRRLLEEVRARLSKDCPRQIAVAAPAFFNARINPVSAETMQWWTNMVLKCSLRVLLDLHRMFTETDFRSELSQISLPTVIIHGDSDTSAPIDRTGRKTATLISGSQLKVYEDAAHGCPSRIWNDLTKTCLHSQGTEGERGSGCGRSPRPPSTSAQRFSRVAGQHC